MTWWDIPRRAWLIILSELAIILYLGSWAVSEYLFNAYFQNYVNSLAPILVPIVSVAFGVSSATVATFLYYGMKKFQQTQEPGEEEPRRKPTPRRTARKFHRKAEPRPSRSEPDVSLGVPRPRFVITGPEAAKNGASKPGVEKKESK